MHVGKLLARLNPKNVRFDVGSGGLPELTTQDIAGAIAFVPAGLGRELMCRVWWPDGAALTAGELQGMLDGVMFGEWRRRADDLVNAQIKLAIAKPETWQAYRAKRGVDDAAASTWPRITAVYGKLRDAVVMEICDPKICPACAGRGAIATAALKKSCVRCDGVGRIGHGPTWRADRMGISHQAFTKFWDRPYDWLLALCNDELMHAERALTRAIGSNH